MPKAMITLTLVGLTAITGLVFAIGWAVTQVLAALEWAHRLLAASCQWLETRVNHPYLISWDSQGQRLGVAWVSPEPLTALQALHIVSMICYDQGIPLDDEESIVFTREP